MDRKSKNPVARKHSEATNFRQTTENKIVVAKSGDGLFYQASRLRGTNCDNIGAVRILTRKTTPKLPDLFARRSTRRISAALAGLITCANVAPAVADTDAASEWVAEAGSASWYAANRHQRRTASGTPYNQNALTAAHPWLPFGTQVRVTRRDTGHSIVVTITDRLPSRRHIIDLSVGAARQLGMLREGTTQVDIAPAS
jgi:rare lipoprotein A